MNDFPISNMASGAVVISPSGRLDMMAAPALREQLRRHVQGGNARLIVDLAAVDLIDSAGLSALISGLKAARQAGGTLHIARPSKPVSALLKLTNLHRVLEPDDSMDGALDEPI